MDFSSALKKVKEGHPDVLMTLITSLWLSTQYGKVRHRIAAAGFDSLSATLLIGLVSK